MPTKVVYEVKKFWREYRINQQEDSHEFIMMFLQAIIKASFRNNPKFVKKYEEESIIFKQFGGKLRSQVRCLECDYKSNHYEPFLSLSLDITHNDTF